MQNRLNKTESKNNNSKTVRYVNKTTLILSIINKKHYVNKELLNETKLVLMS
jgi:hypothetical protein